MRVGFAQEGWLGSLSRYLKARTMKNFSPWIDQMRETLARLGEQLLWPALDHLPKEVEKLIIIPSHEMFYTSATCGFTFRPFRSSSH